MPLGNEKNNFAKKSDELKPRELMERAATPSLVPDEALLAILLKTGVHGLNVKELAHRLIEAFGSLKNLISADWRGLEERIRIYNKANPDKRISGVGHVKCLELAAAFEMGRRWARMSPDEIKQVKIDSAQDAYRLFRAVSSYAEESEFVYVLLLDSGCHPLCEPIVTVKGVGESAVVSPREAFREAVRWGAHAIVVAHNHPTGNPQPSEEDVKMTRRISDVAEVMGIPLLDHLVLGAVDSNGGLGFVSLREEYPECFERVIAE